MSAPGGTVSWETTLISRAYEALDSHRVPSTEYQVTGNDRSSTGDMASSIRNPQVLGLRPIQAIRNGDGLHTAYLHCTRLTKVHSRTFYLASGLLPVAKRQSVRALYAFCRVSDDLVDRAEGEPATALEAWRALLGGSGYARDPVALAWADTRLRHGIPELYGHQLLEGVARDLRVKRYATFDDLAAYCYGVASTVGLMAMHIVGFSSAEAIPYAVKLGVALQLTNILRDVGEDWRAGRLYLPSDELAAYGLSESDVEAGRVDERWRHFMRFQIERNRRLYLEAWPGIAMLSRDSRLAVAAAADLYQAILLDIEQHDMNVFNRRAHLSAWAKARCLTALRRKVLSRPEVGKT